jgi:hypothetical protein
MLRTALLALAGVAALAAAPAGAAPSRTTTVPYTGALGAGTYSLTWEVAARLGYAHVAPRGGERWVEVALTDAAGLPVLFQLWQDGKYVDGNEDVVLGEFCGRTPSRVRLRSDVGLLTVFPRYGACGTGASVPTYGTVKATFSL